MTDIRIEFISSSVLNGMDSNARVGYLIKIIRSGSLVVLEERLTPEEEKLLIEETMNIVDDRFTGIEISSLGGEGSSWRDSLIRMLGGKTGGLTVIGPAKMIKAIKKDGNKINVLAGLKGD